MKIGIVRGDLGSAGGAERYALGLIERLAAAGHAVHVFTAAVPPGLPPVTVHVFPRPRGRHGARRRRAAAFAQWLTSSLEACPLDLLFTLERTWPSDVFRAGDGVHREWMNIFMAGAGRLKAWQVRHSAFHTALLAAEAEVFDAQHTRMVLCNSHMVAAEIVRHYAYPPAQLRVLHNGIDLAGFVPATPQQRTVLRSELFANLQPLVAGEQVLLFAGSGFWRKGLDIAIDLTARLITEQGLAVRLLVVGKGDVRSYARQSARLGIASKVAFLGPRAPAAMLGLYQAADVFVFPTRYDPFANVCLEANACGLPVITTGRNGYAECIGPANGLVLPADPTTAPATAAVADLCRAAGTQAAGAATVRAAVAHLGLEAHVQAVLQLLHELRPDAAGGARAAQEQHP